MLEDVVTIPLNDVEAAVSLIREHGRELACVMVDPMPNQAGLAPADKAYLNALRQITREVGALLIFDEVITFRLGYHGAQGLFDIDPDLTTLGKIMGWLFQWGRSRAARYSWPYSIQGMASRRCRTAVRFRLIRLRCVPGLQQWNCSTRQRSDGLI